VFDTKDDLYVVIIGKLEKLKDINHAVPRGQFSVRLYAKKFVCGVD
jgi:hypothetical protein